MTQKNTRAVSVGSRARLNQAQIGLGKLTENYCFISNLRSPINKLFMRLIYLKNSFFVSLKITFDTLIDGRNETSKHHFFKSVKINTVTFLSVANVPVLSRAQQRAKYSSLSLMAYCIAAKRCLRHYFKLV